MNKKFLTLAVIGLAAGFCLSGQAAPSKKEAQETTEEIAMAKCSKDNNGMQRKRGNCDSDDNSSSSNNGCQSNASGWNKKCTTSKVKKKSAAQKVIQGE